MIQTIGLIVAAYALARLLQVPFELKRDENSGWDFVRLAVVLLVSAAGILAVGTLTYALLNAPAPPQFDLPKR